MIDEAEDLGGRDTVFEDESELPFQHDREPRPSPFRGRTPMLVAAAVILAIVGGYFVVSERNSDRFELHCSRGQAEGRQGMFFPWGTRVIDDDAHSPIVLPSGFPCASARFESMVELDVALGDLLLASAERRLREGGAEAPARARLDIERATRLIGLTEAQRARAATLSADMAYHEAREMIRQVERDLWLARGWLEQAQAEGAGARITDVDEWLEFVVSETERFRPALGGGAHPRADDSRSSERVADESAADQSDESEPAPSTTPQVPDQGDILF